MFFFIVAALLEKYKPMLGHETGATVVLGIVWSCLFYWYNGNNRELIRQYTFNSSSFFDFILPPIIYNAGFNMRRKKFFKNLGNQLIFGLFVTIACFIIYASLTWFCVTFFDLQMTRYMVGEGEEVESKSVEMPIMKLLIFSALLCSSDTVAAVSIIDYAA